jgi:hypothetical protein
MCEATHMVYGRDRQAGRGVGTTRWRNGGQFNRPFVSEQAHVFAKRIQENRGHVL